MEATQLVLGGARGESGEDEGAGEEDERGGACGGLSGAGAHALRSGAREAQSSSDRVTLQLLAIRRGKERDALAAIQPQTPLAPSPTLATTLLARLLLRPPHLAHQDEDEEEQDEDAENLRAGETERG